LTYRKSWILGSGFSRLYEEAVIAVSASPINMLIHRGIAGIDASALVVITRIGCEVPEVGRERYPTDNERRQHSDDDGQHRLILTEQLRPAIPLLPYKAVPFAVFLPVQ